MLTAGPNVQVALVERFANSVSMNHRQTMTTGNTRSGDNDDDGSSASPAVVVEEPDATVVPPPLPQQHGQQRQQHAVVLLSVLLLDSTNHSLKSQAKPKKHPHT